MRQSAPATPAPAASGPAAPEPLARRIALAIDDVRLANARRVRLRLAMTDDGPADAPCWLLLHGISGSHHALAADAGRAADGGWAASWAGPGRLLDTRSQRVLTVNAPGSAYGSDWPDDPAGSTGTLDDHVPVAEAARAIVAALDRLGIDRLHGVIGYSFGGYLAGRLIHDRPDRVRRALLVCSDIAGRGSRADLAAIDALDSAPARAAWRLETVLANGLAAWIADHPDEGGAAERARIVRWADEFDARAIRRLRAAAIGHRLPALPPRTTRLLASSDRLFPPPADPGADPATRIVTTRYGHQSLLLEPADWHDALARWLRE